MKAKRNKALARALLKRGEQALDRYCELMFAQGHLNAGPDMSYLDPAVQRDYPVVKTEELTQQAGHSNPCAMSSYALVPTPRVSIASRQAPREEAPSGQRYPDPSPRQGPSDVC